jgi:seryl-tRNA synthetase
MLDLKLIRENSEQIKERLKTKGYDFDIAKIVDWDKKKGQLLIQVEKLKEDRNKITKTIGEKKRAGAKVELEELFLNMKKKSETIKNLDAEILQLEGWVREQLLQMPNLPFVDLPIGSAENNQEVRIWGEKARFDFAVKPHWEIAEKLDIIDFKRGAKISGSGFLLYKGWGAKLERALINFMLDLHTEQHGYKEILPPFIVNQTTMTGTGQLPNLADDMYKIANEDSYLIPTAEVPVTNIFRDEILAEKDLPICFVAQSPCFRQEAGSYGKDARGMIRVHQFNKVELVRFVHPEKSYDELELLLTHAEKILQKLNLHYRVVLLATGDLSFSAAKCYDIEVWAPGMKKYLEVSSCSNFEDFQARRMAIRYKSETDKKNRLVHTLNGSGLALPRLVVAIIENYQTADGRLEVPKVLAPYLGADKYL